jgi:hypothetical protein
MTSVRLSLAGRSSGVVALLLDPAAVLLLWPPTMGALVTQSLAKAAVTLRARFWHALVRRLEGVALGLLRHITRGNCAVPILFSDRDRRAGNATSSPEFVTDKS